MKTALFLVFCLFGFNSSFAQLTVYGSGATAQSVADSLGGSGIGISNPVITGGSSSYGFFTEPGGVLGIPAGILLTTGSISNALGPNNSTSQSAGNGTSGDVQLNLLTSGISQDACILEFDFVPLTDTVHFQYVFASEEYNEFVNSSFNDVFGFFISGPGLPSNYNIALLPGTNAYVSINNVNNGNSSGASAGPCMNCTYFTDNTGGTVTEYDGYTTVLTATAILVPGTMYHMKLAIADVSDGAYDSGMFLSSGSFASSGPLVMNANNNKFYPDTLLLNSGESVTLSVPAGFLYSWSNGVTSNINTVNQTGNYQVIVTDSAMSWMKIFPPVHVGIASIAQPVITQQGMNLISSLNDSSLIYTWNLNGTPISNSNNPVYTYSQSGCYSITAATLGGNSLTSDTVCVSITGITEIQAQNFYVNPNPGNGLISFSFPDKFNTNDFKLLVFNSAGIKIKEMDYKSGQEKIADLRKLPEGIYQLLIIQDNQIAKSSIIIHK